MLKINVSLLCICILLVVTSAAQSNEKNIKISTSTWGHPKNAKEVLKIRPLASVMRKLINRPQAKLNILYHGDDKGTDWATNIRGWLISLGLKSDRIILSPESYKPDIIVFRIQ